MINNDHVFPTSWYPDNTPSAVQRWTAPSCVKCNSEHGRNEEDLLGRLAVCLDPQDPRASGLAAKALRSIQPQFGKNERDQAARQAKRQKMRKETIFTAGPPTKGVLPNFGRNPNLDYGLEVALVKISKAGLVKLGEKIVRGVEYHLGKQYLDSSVVKIEVFFVEDVHGAEIAALLDKFGETFDLGPGVTVKRGIPVDRDAARLFLITFWERFKIYGTILPIGGTQVNIG